MKLHDIKKLLRLLKELDIESEDRKEIFSQIQNDNEDFELANYRFINQQVIDKVLADELSSDTYLLGSFNPWFIADQTGLPQKMIEITHQASAFDVVGESVLSLCDINSFAKAYTDSDGYGNYFSPYDGEEIEIEDYSAFRIN